MRQQWDSMLVLLRRNGIVDCRRYTVQQNEPVGFDQPPLRTAVCRGSHARARVELSAPVWGRPLRFRFQRASFKSKPKFPSGLMNKNQPPCFKFQGGPPGHHARRLRLENCWLCLEPPGSSNGFLKRFWIQVAAAGGFASETTTRRC
jgi:hypothetical protein